MSVSYDKAMKEKARTEKRSLYTISTSWPGGKEAFTMQGYADDKRIEKIQKFMHGIIKEENAKKKNKAS